MPCATEVRHAGSETIVKRAILAGRHHPKNRVPDVLGPNLDILFVGFNPSLVSWQKGHHYANPVNQFYRLLNASRLTPRLLRPEEDVCLPQWGIGLTNLVMHLPSANASDVPARIYRQARTELEKKILRYKPRIVVFNGIRIFEYYYGRRPRQLGLQPERAGQSLVFVLPSSSGAANAYIKERLKLFRALRNLKARLHEVRQRC